MSDFKTRALMYRINKTVRLLECFGVKTKEMRFDESTGLPYIPCAVELDGETIAFRFPINKLGRRFYRELERLDKACYCGTVKLEDVKTLFIILSVPKVIYKYRSRLRRHIGLIKDEKLRKYAIWRRIKAVELIRGSPLKGVDRRLVPCSKTPTENVGNIGFSVQPPHKP